MDLAIIPMILVLSTPPLVWFARHWTIYIDSAEYLMLASNLISDQGYTQWNGDPHVGRGPVFPALIGSLMVFFGRDVESLALGVRLLASLNPLLTFLLMRRISGLGSGLLAAALVILFSYTATTIEAFNVDAFMLTGYLLAVLTLLASVRTGNIWLALLSGLLLGTTILIKETAFTNLPIALLAALLLGWSPRGVFWHYLGVTLVCLPWWAWVWSVSGELYLVGRLPEGLRIPALTAVLVIIGVAVGLYFSGLPARFLAGAHRRRWTGWSLAIVWTIVISGLLLTTSAALKDLSLEDVGHYVVSNLAAYTPLWPLLVVAGGYVAWEAWRGSEIWQFYAAALVLQVPVCSLVMLEGFSLRQFLVPQTLLLCALGAFVAEICAVAARERRRLRPLTITVAALLCFFLLLSAIAQVRLLLGEPDSWTLLDRTSRVNAENVQTLRGIRKMDRWIVGNVPKRENILLLEAYSNYQVFLDGDRHGWTRLELNCGVGLRNPSTEGCVPSKVVATEPPKPTVWFSLDENCKAIALSMSSVQEQLEESKSDFLMISNNFKYPSILGSASYLADSNAFEVAHEERMGKDDGTGRALVLLKRTGKAPGTPPTQMDAQSAANLIKCENVNGPEDWERVRSRFPDGILIETSPDGNSEESSIVEARETLEQIYSNH
jgi:4-amino-4-deoxy-L-arabinose transferase-like glycosyltransferase